MQIVVPGEAGRIQTRISQYWRLRRQGPVAFEPIDIANYDVVEDSVDGTEP